MTATVSTAIHTRALLVWLNISTWSARKYDRKVSNEVNAKYAASQDAGRYNKHLLPGDAKSYKTLIALAARVREWHYTQTLAWSDAGWRLLPVENFERYTQEYRARQCEMAAAVRDFAADYPALRDQARILLNGLYQDGDYPQAADISSKFAIDVQYAPVPSDGDVRVDLARDQIVSIERSIQDRIESAVAVATRDAWERLYEVAANIRTRLSDPDAIFRDSLINNAIATCDALKRLNVTNDPDLERMRAAVAADLTTVDPDVLRDTKTVRAAVASKADSILRDMSALMGKL